MKIQCDVCNKNEASVFCSADEAALCHECDQTVHFANKLASKHHRFSLVQPSSPRFPICDICQVKRALLFCQQDRAILCRDCDISLHTANEFTQKHNRFLLTGSTLSATVSDNRNDTAVPDKFNSVKKPTSVLSEIPTTTKTTSVVSNSSCNSKSKSSVNDEQLICGGSTMSSNISDYLIDELPGWHFDDFILDPPASTNNTPFGFSKSGNNNCNNPEVHDDMWSFINVENEKNFRAYDSTQAENLWVPQAPTAATTTTLVYDHTSMFSQNTTDSVLGYGTKQQETSVKYHRKTHRRDDAFTVPEITASVGCKRNRSFW